MGRLLVIPCGFTVGCPLRIVNALRSLLRPMPCSRRLQVWGGIGLTVVIQPEVEVGTCLMGGIKQNFPFRVQSVQGSDPLYTNE